MREKKGYSRDELGERMGVSKNHICNWENGKFYPSLMSLICAADVLECTLDELVGRKESNG